MNAGVLNLPANITKEVKETIQEFSLKTFKVLGCSGVIRIDFIIYSNNYFYNIIYNR